MPQKSSKCSSFSVRSSMPLPSHFKFSTLTSHFKFSTLFMLLRVLTFSAVATCLTTVTKPLSLTHSGLPLLLLDPYVLLLDTGSEELWLADSTCHECPLREKICPQISQNAHVIHYLKGQVIGDYSYIKIGGIRSRFMCVKEATNIGKIEAHGILGIKGSSNGKQFVKKYIQGLQVSSKLALYFGVREAKIFFGELPEKYYAHRFQLAATIKGRVRCTQVLASSAIITSATELAFDSASEMLILPKHTYASLLSHLTATYSPCTFQFTAGIALKCHSSLNVPLNITLDFYLNDHQSLQLIFVKDENNLIQLPIIQFDEHHIVLGKQIFQAYIIQLDLQSETLSVYSRDTHLLEEERINFIIGVLLYAVFVSLCSYGLHTLYLLLLDSMNKKIII